MEVDSGVVVLADDGESGTEPAALSQKRTLDDLAARVAAIDERIDELDRLLFGPLDEDDEA